MAKDIKFLKAHRLNGKDYKKGDELKVSTSIYNNLTALNIAKEEKKAPSKARKK